MDVENDIAMAMAFPLLGNTNINFSTPKLQVLKEVGDEAIEMDNDMVELMPDKMEEMEINQVKEELITEENIKDMVFRKRADSGISLGSEISESIDLGIKNFQKHQQEQDGGLLDKVIKMLGLIAHVKGKKEYNEIKEESDEVINIYNSLLDLQSSIQPQEILKEAVESPLDQEFGDSPKPEINILNEANMQYKHTQHLVERDYKALLDDMMELNHNQLPVDMNGSVWNRTKDYITRYLGSYINLRNWAATNNTYLVIPIVVSFTLALFFLNLSKSTINKFLKKN